MGQWARRGAPKDGADGSTAMVRPAGMGATKATRSLKTSPASPFSFRHQYSPSSSRIRKKCLFPL